VCCNAGEVRTDRGHQQKVSGIINLENKLRLRRRYLRLHLRLQFQDLYNRHEHHPHVDGSVPQRGQEKAQKNIGRDGGENMRSEDGGQTNSCQDTQENIRY
jgi:hypothetical protein